MLGSWLLTISLVLAALLASALYLWHRRRTATRGSDQRTQVEVLSDEEERRQALRRLAEERIAERREQRPD